MQTCLIVANQTLPTESLAEEIRHRVRASERRYHVVVPLLPLEPGQTLEDSRSADATQNRLDRFLAALRDEGVEADGEIGDQDPITAVRDVMDEREIDEIILSTLEPGLSKWLQLDVPSRLARAVDIPVTVVTPQAVSAPS